MSSKLLLCVLSVLLLASPLLPGAAPARPDAAPPYRLDLQFSPAAAFPFMKRFGAIDISVFPRGLRAETLLAEGFSTLASKHITIENSVARTYSEVPISDLRRLLLLFSGKKKEAFPGLRAFPVERAVLSGSVRGVKASRYRIRLGPSAWIDVWTTTIVPPNRQLQRLQQEFLTALSVNAAKTAASIPGTPLYVELNTSRFKKIPVLRMKDLVFSSAGEAEALKPGPFLFQANGFKL